MEGKTIITCPYCGNREEVSISVVSDESTHRCDRCKREIRARKGEHCVVCSYGEQTCGQE